MREFFDLFMNDAEMFLGTVFFGAVFITLIFFFIVRGKH